MHIQNAPVFYVPLWKRVAGLKPGTLICQVECTTNYMYIFVTCVSVCVRVYGSLCNYLWDVYVCVFVSLVTMYSFPLNGPYIRYLNSVSHTFHSSADLQISAKNYNF